MSGGMDRDPLDPNLLKEAAHQAMKDRRERLKNWAYELIQLEAQVKDYEAKLAVISNRKSQLESYIDGT